MNPMYIIPARAGSKGIPGKNIKPLAGIPLLSYTVRTALQVAEPDRIILSTDSEDIASVARSEGLDVTYMRPRRLGLDTTPSRDVILDVMQWADSQVITYDSIVLLQPTSPLRTADDITRCLETWDIYAPEIDLVVTVAESPANPYYDIFERGEDGYLRISKGDGTITRRQDAPQAWQYTGAVYVINPRTLLTTSLGNMPRRVGVPTDRSRAIDLDTPIDWLVAEQLILNSQQSSRTER